MTQNVDVAIVGGGAAGIAAARTLHTLNRSVLLIEALPRLGGRAHTQVVSGMPLDLGCGWLHSAKRNALAALAVEQNQLLDRSESAWHRQLHNIHFSPQQQRDAWKAFQDLEQCLHSNPPPSDRVGDAIAADDPWRQFLDGVSSYINGAELDRLSVADYLAYEDASTDDNWRLPDGYGRFIVNLAHDIPTALGTRVTSITQGNNIALATSGGTVQARAVIVTVSTAVLAQGNIRFDPAVDDHLHAAAHLPLGLADKLYLSVTDLSAVPPESHLLGRLDRAETGSYYIRPFGRPVIECFLGGTCALALEEAGTAAAHAFAIGELRSLLGAQFAQGLVPLAATRWAHEPSIRGSYSHALPGHCEARITLARPVSERFYFAGEACSRTDFSTAHGAWESGLAAAQSAERFLATRG